MKIDNVKRREIREALLDAFPTPGELAIITSDVLGEPLQNITAVPGPMPNMAFDLIVWSNARGRLTELVMGAAAANPTNPKLRALADRFKFAEHVPGENERVIMKDVPFQNVGQWLDKLAHARRAVCRIEPQPPPDYNNYGSGFLVAADVVMTNYHLVQPFLNNGADKVVLRFDYETDKKGVAVGEGRPCKLAADWDLVKSPVNQLDFALVRLSEPVGNDAINGGTRGALKPLASKCVKDRPLLILQHPAAEPLKLAIGSVVDPDSYPNRVAYNVNTEGGSSGSPCFSSALDVVAIHHWGAPNHNRGVTQAAILNYLKSNAIELKLADKGLAHLIN
jgi:hypothetical protein